MNRQERRRQAREAPRLPASPDGTTNAIAQALRTMAVQQSRMYTEQQMLDCIEAGKREGYGRGWQDASFHTIKACYAALGIVLHESFGFGQERILKAMQAVDSKVALCIEHEELADEFFESTGMQIDFADSEDRITLKRKVRMK